MIEVMSFLASYSNVGTAIGNMFQTWQQIGFFDYLLPFLLIFVLVFGILTKVDIFKGNKVINAIIALVVGLIAIQFPGVSQFFSVIFPHLGIALAIILVIFIIAGLFLTDKINWINYVLLGIAGIIIIVVLVTSANSLGLPAGQWVAENWSMAVAVIVIIGLVVAIIGATKGTNPSLGGGGGSTKKFDPMWAR